MAKECKSIDAEKCFTLLHFLNKQKFSILESMKRPNLVTLFKGMYIGDQNITNSTIGLPRVRLGGVFSSGSSHILEPAQELHSRAGPSVRGNTTAQLVQPQGEILEEGRRKKMCNSVLGLL